MPIPPPPPAIAQPGPCTARQLAVRLDGEDGAFDGMSHAGARVIVRNTGRAACRIGGLPRIAFTRADGRLLPIVRKAPVGMHPGPAIATVTIAPGVIASTGLRWVSGEVYDRSRCFAPAWMTLGAGATTVRVRFAGRLCGPGDATATFEQAPLVAARPAG